MRTPLLVVLGLLMGSSSAKADYTVRATPLLGEPRTGSKALDRLDANQTVTVLRRDGVFVKVRVGVDGEGFVPAQEIESRWIKVWKAERKLFLMDGEKATDTFTVALGADHPVGDKVKQGDGATPEGRFFLGELDPSPEPGRYGARSMRLSYPGIPHARRGLQTGLIPRRTYEDIVRAIAAGTMPPQKTPLGGSIRIHGGGGGRDWTLGCIALSDGDVAKVFEFSRAGMRVEVFASAEDEKARRRDLGVAILRGAKAQLLKPALYTAHAMQALPLPYPGGDIAQDEAVCTDIVVRALRAAGVDLQALVHEDRLVHADRYPGNKAVKPNIDHRRVPNLVAFFRRHAREGRVNARGDLRPGDVVVFDTGIRNGTPFDHIGIVDDTKDGNGNFQAINIWTVGWKTSSMALIGKDYPTVAAWFRVKSAW